MEGVRDVQSGNSNSFHDLRFATFILRSSLPFIFLVTYSVAKLVSGLARFSRSYLRE
eukprot:SAG31_NODE_1319_length_8817_cov_1.857077_7_plen_57_part_00